MLDKLPQTQLSFNYDVIPEPAAVQAREAAQRIKLRMRRAVEDVIEIGRDLLVVKERIGHGNFLPWIQAEFSMSESAANKIMNVARVYGPKSVIVTDLPVAALYELAAPKTPIEVREEIERMIEAGEVVTKATVTKLKEEADAAKKGKELADKDAEEAEAKAASVQAAKDEAIAVEVQKAAAQIKAGYDAEIKRLSDQIAELRKPKTVTTIDNETGNVVPLHRDLTTEQEAEIDSVDDDLVGADFNEVASETERAKAFFGSVRAMASAKASPAAVYAYITKRRSQDLINEYMGMVGDVLSQLQAIKEMDRV